MSESKKVNIRYKLIEGGWHTFTSAHVDGLFSSSQSREKAFHNISDQIQALSIKNKNRPVTVHQTDTSKDFFENGHDKDECAFLLKVTEVWSEEEILRDENEELKRKCAELEKKLVEEGEK